MNNKRTLFIFILVVAVSLSSYFYFQHKQKSTIEEIPIVSSNTGNTNGNIVNGGFAAKGSNWIFISALDGVYKLKNELSTKEKISRQQGPYLNVVKDELFFGFESLNKVKIDGTEHKTLDNVRVRYIHVLDGWVYYVTESEDGQKLYKIRTDGTEKTLLVNGNINLINVTKDWVFFSMKVGESGIYKVNKNGEDKTIIVKENPWQFIIDEDWVFYTSLDENYCLYKVRLDGTEKTKITDDEVWTFNVSNGWIYYQNRSVNTPYDNKNIGYLYKLKTDGTEKQKISEAWASDINIIDDWIYFLEIDKEDPGEGFVRMKIDGSNREMIN